MTPFQSDLVPAAQSASGRALYFGALRLAWLGAAVLPLLAAGGCGATPTEEHGAAAVEAVCPADEPDCDRLDQPCVEDDGDPGASPMGPGASPMGLAENKTAAGKYRIWPKGRVPYKLDASLDAVTRGRVLTAMGEWQTKSEQRVRFEKATASDTTYLVLHGGSLPITSVVGYRAGTISKVKLRHSEYLTVIRHELGHVLGLHHEQRRTDRADHIQVKTANIADSALCKNQFNVCTDCVPIKSYNVKSVMHYRTTDLSNCRTGPVLLNKDGTAISHPWLISSGDLAVIAELYASPTGVTGDAGGSGGASGAGGAAGAGGAVDTGSGGAAGSTGGAAGAAGAAGQPGIDTPDETGGASGAAGAPSSAGSGGGAGTSPGNSAQNTAEDGGGCAVHGGGRFSTDSMWVALAMLSLGVLGRRRGRAARR